MSNFECPVVRIERVVPHPDADRLDLVYFRDFAVISQRGLRHAGDLVVYCPQDSIIPLYLLKQGFYRYDVETVGPELPQLVLSKNPVTIPAPEPSPDQLSTPGFSWTHDGIQYRVLDSGKGMLAGSNGDRVKPVKLRGILSEGIMFPVLQRGSLHVEEYYVQTADGDRTIKYEALSDPIEIEGFNAAEVLGITKYEPVLPPSMSGDSVYIGTSTIPHFDIENIKKYPDILDPQWEVIVTEKLHGTFFGIGYVPGLNHPDLWHGDFFCYSKGQGNRGIVFKNTEANKSNLYVRWFEKILPLLKDIADRSSKYGDKISPKFFMGEIFGAGVQDLNYGTRETSFRLFDVYSGGAFVDWSDVERTAHHLKVDVVPVLYRGLYRDYDRDLKNGNSTLAKHVREGAVIKPTVSRRHKILGRIILKDINEKYLTRKGGTEYN